jgi:hypothetical protein
MFREDGIDICEKEILSLEGNGLSLVVWFFGLHESP